MMISKLYNTNLIQKYTERIKLNTFLWGYGEHAHRKLTKCAVIMALY